MSTSTATATGSLSRRSFIIMRHQFLLFRPQVMIIALLVSFALSTAQQYPNPALHINQFNTTVPSRFRQNICGRQRRYDMGNITRLDNALEGLNLHIALPADSAFVNFDEDGRIDENYPGILVVLLDQVAANAKFTWRDTYTVVDAPMEGETWTDLIVWLTQTYDVAADWWINTIDRTSKGIAYPESWYDASFVLVGKKPASATEEEEKLALWSWLEPFDYAVWLATLLTIVASGFIYMFLDYVDPYSDKRKLKSKPIETTFLAAMGFAGHMEFEPQTHAARLFTFSLALWALLMGAAYTANLASFLVYTQRTYVGEIPITSVEEAVQRQVPICVHGGTPTAQQLKSDYPNAYIIEKAPDNAADRGVYQGVIDGECKVALTTYGVWRLYEHDGTVNQNCQLEWIGRKYKNREAGFATAADAGTKCTSLIRDVFNIHLRRMKEQEFIEDAWQQEFKRTATTDCSSSSSTASEGGRRDLKASSLSASASIGAESGESTGSSNASLSIKNMGGIFIMHGGFCFIAVIFALVHRWFGLQERREKEKEKKNRRNHLKKMQATKGMSKCSFGSLDNNDDDDDDDDERPAARGLTYATFLAEIDEMKEEMEESRKKQMEEVGQLRQDLATLIRMVAENNKKSKSSDDDGDDLHHTVQKKQPSVAVRRMTAETARVDSTSSTCSRGDVTGEASNNKRHHDDDAVGESSTRRAATQKRRVDLKTSSAALEGSSADMTRPTRDERIRNIAFRQSKHF